MSGSSPSRQHPTANPVVAASLWMLVMAVCTAVMMALVRILAANLHPLEILFFRALLTFPLVWLWARAAGPGESRWPKRPGLAALRGLFTTLALTAFYWGLASGTDLALATTLTFTVPIFLTILGFLFFKEQVGRRRWVAVLVGFFGTVIVIRPDAGSMDPGSLMILGAACFWAGDALMVKLLARVNGAVTIVLAQTFVMLVLSAPAALFVWQTPTGTELILLLVTGIFSTLAQYAFTRAVGLADMSVIAPVLYSQLLITAVLGYLLFDEVPGLALWLGAAIILAATFDMLRAEARARKSSGRP